MKDIEDFEGLYAVTEGGKVWSFPKTGTGGHCGKFLKQTIYKGYCYVSLCRDGRIFRKLVHRLVAKAYISNPHGLKTVNHINFDKSDNRCTNLEWCSQLENIRHAIKNDRFPIGERNYKCKLSSEDVKTIRLLRKSGVLLKVLAARYNVGFSHICAISRGRERRRVA